MQQKIEIVQFLSGEFDFEIKFIQPHHLRLSHHDGRRLDYFPKSGRATYVSSQKWFKIDDIEKYLEENFK